MPYNISNLNDLINLIKMRPPMYIGGKKLSTLYTFLDGYQFALQVHTVETEEINALPFWFFHTWVARYYNRSDSARGWCGIILEENNNDEEKSLDVFFELFEQFSSLKTLSVQQMKLNEQSIQFHYSDDCYPKRIIDLENWIEGPLYENPTEVTLLELSDKWGYVYHVLNGKIEWERQVYKNEQEAKDAVETLFGDFSVWVKE